MITGKGDVGEIEGKPEASKEGKKESWGDRMFRRSGVAVLLFVGFFALGAVMAEYRMKEEGGWALFLGFASIPAAFTGLVEWMWRTFFDVFKSAVDFRRLVYGLVVITYLGFLGVHLVDKSSAQSSRPIKLDVNLSTPSYAPIRIDVQHTHKEGRTY